MTEERRLEQYRDFKAMIERARQCFATLELLNQPILKELRRLCQEMQNARAELIKIFSSDEIYQICHECKGRCCGSLCRSRSDAAYLVLLSYQLPEPTKYSFPSEVRPYDGDSYCSFLSQIGCILRENRPLVCLTHICYELRKKLGKGALEEVDKKCQAVWEIRGKFDDILIREGYFQGDYFK